MPLSSPAVDWIDQPPVRWHVTRRGRGLATLLLHGAGGSAETFAALVSSLGEGFATIAVDLPGHAGSRCRDGFQPTLGNIVWALERLLERLDVRPAMVIGHSVGAAIAVHWAERHPTPVVALAPALSPLSGVIEGTWRPLAQALHRSPRLTRLASRLTTTERVRALLRRFGPEPTASTVEHHRRLFTEPTHLHGTLGLLSNWDVRGLHARLPRFTSPILMLAGEHDRAIPVERQRAVFARIPEATLDVVADTGHLLHEERPDAVAVRIRKFAGENLSADSFAPDGARSSFLQPQRMGAPSWPY